NSWLSKEHSEPDGFFSPFSDVNHRASRTFTTNQPSAAGASPEPESSSGASGTARVYGCFWRVLLAERAAKISIASVGDVVAPRPPRLVSEQFPGLLDLEKRVEVASGRPIGHGWINLRHQLAARTV